MSAKWPTQSAQNADLLADMLGVGRHIPTEDESYMQVFGMTKDDWQAHTADWEGLGATLVALNDVPVVNPWIGPDGRLID